MGLFAEALRASPWAEVLRQEGEEEGRQKGALRMLNILIQKRFGDVSESRIAALHLLSIDQLEELAELLLQSKSLDEFIDHVARMRDN